MRVTRIDYDEEQDPSEVHLVLTHDELLFLTTMLGKSTYSEREAVMPGGGELGGGIYDGANRMVWNPYYEDGHAEALESYRTK